MSKLIESLKASAKEYSKKDQERKGYVSGMKTDYELTQEQLADIYFSSAEKLKRSDQPLIIKVIEKPRAAPYLPWLVTSIAFLITAFSLFSTKRIFIDIKVIDEHSPMLSTTRGLRETPPQNGPTEPFTPAATTPNADLMVYGDKFSMDDFVFEGASRLQSSKDKESLTLVNSSVSPFARASFRFPSPVNFTGSKIVFYAKGGHGGENVAVALKDKDNVTAFSKGKIYPFSNGLSADWQRAEIPVLSTDGKFDASSVVCLRFEIGSKDTENKPGDTVFVKELQVVPL